uniref:Uncharacterized protein n=1 Tax=Arundo donax TaxID=35708 RepID=A0A0A9DHH7_ARUDO
MLCVLSQFFLMRILAREGNHKAHNLNCNRYI